MKALRQVLQHSRTAAAVAKAAGAERRYSARCDAQLEARLLFSLSPWGAERLGGPHAQLPSLLEGYTRNLSETGLAIVVPALHFGGRYLNVVGSPLHIQLQLPEGSVRMRATTVRAERLGDGEEGYLIGVRIAEMNDSEWVRLVQYVRTLRAA